MKKMNIDNPFFNFMGRLADLVLLNLLFLLCSLPIITIGASLTALYQCCDDMAEGEFISAFRNFFGTFRKQLKKGIKTGLVFLVTGCLLIFDIIFLGGTGGRNGWSVIGIGVGCLFVLWEMIFCYIFPVVLKKGGGVIEMSKESMLLAVRNFPYTIIMALLNMIPLLSFILGGRILISAIPIYLLFGFGLTAYINTGFLRRCV